MSFLSIFVESLFQISSYFVTLLKLCGWLIKGEIIHAILMTDKYQSHHIVVL